ncbi:MAG: DUF559 domain-containing protein [Methylocystis sp.]|uniref:DUF559 domain-containing protein n=1 Tax=Methylocystis sp. TaxID=1911079 RepID=UPI003D0E725A
MRRSRKSPESSPPPLSFGHSSDSLKSRTFTSAEKAPIGPYFADFACHRTRSVVEIDGGRHGFDAERRREESARVS